MKRRCLRIYRKRRKKEINHPDSDMHSLSWNRSKQKGADIWNLNNLVQIKTRYSLSESIHNGRREHGEILLSAVAD